MLFGQSFITSLTIISNKVVNIDLHSSAITGSYDKWEAS